MTEKFLETITKRIEAAHRIMKARDEAVKELQKWKQFDFCKTPSMTFAYEAAEYKISEKSFELIRKCEIARLYEFINEQNRLFDKI